MGLKETYEHLISRVLSFGRYMFDFQQYDAVRELFADKTFLTLARNVCPADKQVLDPFQFNFILQIPGQTVALHIDAPYFWVRCVLLHFEINIICIATYVIVLCVFVHYSPALSCLTCC